MSLELPLLETKQASSLHEFISHWRKFYYYIDETRYMQNINLNKFSRESLTDLFHWKNGMTLAGSGGKEKALNTKILDRIELINKYKSDLQVDLSKFNKDFEDVSAVWRVFLLHLINPLKYPIYDQHIHRAYNYLHRLTWTNISNTLNNKDKLEFYFSLYLPFVANSEITDLKGMDEAFFAFGQFLNTRAYYKMI